MLLFVLRQCIFLPDRPFASISWLFSVYYQLDITLRNNASVIIHLISIICVNYKVGLFSNNSHFYFLPSLLVMTVLRFAKPSLWLASVFLSRIGSIKYVNKCNLLHNFIGCFKICRRSHIMCSCYDFTSSNTVIVEKISKTTLLFRNCCREIPRQRQRCHSHRRTRPESCGPTTAARRKQQQQL